MCQPEAVLSCQPARHILCHTSDYVGVGQRTTCYLQQWAGFGEDLATAYYADEPLGHVHTDADKQIEQEDSGPEAKGVSDHLLGESRSPARCGKAKEEHSAAKHDDIALDHHNEDLYCHNDIGGCYRHGAEQGEKADQHVTGQHR